MDKDTRELKDTVKRILPPQEYIEKLNQCDNILDLDFSTYCRLLMFLTPQKRTALIEKRFRLYFGWQTVDPKKERGDYIDSDNKYFELKTSCPNSSNKILLGQIRIWQPVDYYLALYINCYDLINSQAFMLTKEQMEDEAFNIGHESHKTKFASEGDKKRELTISINIDKSSPDNIRWTKLYKSNILKGIINF